MTLPDAEKLCGELVRKLKPLIGPKTAMIGLYTGGAWLAERLHRELSIERSLGLMDIAFYRDDYAARGLKHDPKRTKIPFDVNGCDLLLVDDVLYSGRTVRAAVGEHHQRDAFGPPVVEQLVHRGAHRASAVEI